MTACLCSLFFKIQVKKADSQSVGLCLRVLQLQACLRYLLCAVVSQRADVQKTALEVKSSTVEKEISS